MMMRHINSNLLSGARFCFSERHTPLLDSPDRGGILKNKSGRKKVEKTCHFPGSYRNPNAPIHLSFAFLRVQRLEFRPACSVDLLNHAGSCLEVHTIQHTTHHLNTTTEHSNKPYHTVSYLLMNKPLGALHPMILPRSTSQLLQKTYYLAPRTPTKPNHTASH